MRTSMSISLVLFELSHSLIPMLSVAAVPPPQSWVVTAEDMQPAQPAVVALRPFKKPVGPQNRPTQLLLSGSENTDHLHVIPFIRIFACSL